MLKQRSTSKGEIPASTIPYNSCHSASQTCALIRSGVYDNLDASSTIWKCSYPRHPQCSRTTHTCQVDEPCLTRVVMASCAGQQGSSSSAPCHIFSIASSWTSTEVWRPFVQRSPNSQWPKSRIPHSIHNQKLLEWIYDPSLCRGQLHPFLELDSTCNRDTPVPAEHPKDVCNWPLIPTQEQE